MGENTISAPPVVRVIDPGSFCEWENLAQSHRYGTLFHTTAWAKVLIDTFGYEPCYLAVERDGKLTSGIAFMTINSWLTGRRIISLPRTSYCDPLISSPEDQGLLIQAAIDLCASRKCNFFEIKTQKNECLASMGGLKAYGHFKNHILDIQQDTDTLWAHFDRSCVRQRISRAQKSGVLIRMGSSLEDVKAFYRLHLQSTRKNGVPHRPFSFFRNMWNTFAAGGKIFLPLAEVGSELAAAGVMLRSNDSLIFEFLGNNYSLMDHSPVHMIVWEMIMRAKQEGLRYFDFGMTPPGNKGLLAFKNRWGAEERTLQYFYYPDVKGYKSYITQSSEDEAPLDSRIRKSVALPRAAIASRLYRHFG